jgi:hypothetical protein
LENIKTGMYRLTAESGMSNLTWRNRIKQMLSFFR